ncbi:MAG: flagellar hook assembly protein FlgD [Azonexus sp.]|jgi:flagellar basal-body rod modification protein FlgD|nr:flagellar hook assembly protein FlgD [Azonexus sp.]
MATVNSTTSTNPAADLYAQINSAGGASAATSEIEETQNRFLTLLVAQLQNQDPLNPLDNAQVTQQMAQLSTVSGIEKLNATMAKLLTSYSDSQSMQAASLIGRNVMVAGNNLPMVEGQSVGGVALSAPADSVLLSVKDASGKVVQTVDLGARDANDLTFYFSWDGTDADGNVLPDGNYTFEVTASANGQDVAAAPMQIGMVNALVRDATGGFLLDLGSFGYVSFDKVLQII